MSVSAKAWESELVRTWLECRIDAARLDQTAADILEPATTAGVSNTATDQTLPPDPHPGG